MDRWIHRVRETQPPGLRARRWGIHTHEEAWHWIHHDTPLVVDPEVSGYEGQQLRHAALAFHSQVQQERYVTGRMRREEASEPEYMVDLDHVNALAPAAAGTH